MRYKSLIYGYLILPIIVFWWGWFNVWVAVFATVGLFIFLKEDFKTSIFNDNVNFKTLIVCALTAFVWTYLSGIGGFRPQHFDYHKHNLLINNLVRFDWPVVYPSGQYLCYNLAYYLVPTFLAKLWGGIAQVELYVFIWSWLGLCLVFIFLVKNGGYKFLLFFILFNSIEAVFYVYQFFVSPLSFSDFITDLFKTDHNIELIRTVGGLKYLSPVKLITSGPQHAIGSWLCTALLIDLFKNETKNLKISQLLFPILILTYWSPLVAFGLFLITGFAVLISHFNSAKILLLDSKTCLIAIGMMLFPAIVYFEGHVSIGENDGYFLNSLSNLHQYLLFGVFLFIHSVFWLFLYRIYNQDFKSLKANLFLAALIILFLLPFYKYGFYNDLMMRASIPAIFIVCYCIFPIFNRLDVFKISLLLLICSIPVYNHLQWLSKKPYREMTNERVKDLGKQTIYSLNQYHKNEFNAANQYLGNQNSIYISLFMNK